MWFIFGLLAGTVLGWIANERKHILKKKASEALKSVNNKVKDL